MAADVHPPGWVALRRLAQPALRLCCFPYAGGGPAAFARWVRHLPPSWDLLVLQLPGRGARLGEQALHDFDAAREQACTHLQPWLDRPCLFFGHSLGAILAYEVARRCGDRLQGLVVSACVAPRHWPTERGRALARLDRDGLVAALREYNGMPAQVLDDDEVLDLLLPAMQADFDLVASYRYRGPAGLEVPMHVLHGADDPHVDPGRLQGWALETRGPCGIERHPGDHFFIDGREAVIIRSMTELPRLGALSEGTLP